MWQVDCYFAVLKHVPCDLQNFCAFLGRCSGNELYDNLCHKLVPIVIESAVYSSVLGNIVMDEGILSSLWIKRIGFRKAVVLLMSWQLYN